jgi:hypothetical protein
MASDKAGSSQTTTETELREKILEKIKLSGKPFEMVVSSYLDRFGWKSITNTDTFFDSDEKKLRDIDIVASNEPCSIGNLELESYLVIECKKETKCAWVFYTRPYKFAAEDITGHYLDEAQMAAKSTENIEILEMILKDAKLHYEKTTRVAVTYERVPIYQPYDPEKEEEQSEKQAKVFDSITKAQNQLKKYVDWSLDQDIRQRTQLLPRTVEMYFPCIVLAGLLYEVILEDGTPTLKPKDHIVLTTLHRSPHSVYEKNLLIDVVTENYFREYQNEIRNDISSMKEAIEKNEGIINKRINEILSLLESARRNR